MAEGGHRPLFMILGWTAAAVLLLLYLSTKFDISFHRKSAPGEALTSTPPAEETSNVTAAKKTKATQPAPVPARVLSTEELFQMASPAVMLIEIYDEEGHKRGLGSGFAVSSDGTVVTNYHVIRGASRATAKFGDGTFATVSGVVAYDPGHDVAVIKVQGASPPTLKLGNSDSLRVGDHVVAIGSPLGLQNTMSEGIVSALRMGIVQMSAPISPGSSGGPVLNTAGEVVAVSVATVTEGQNLNFAVPINWTKRYIGQSPPRSLADVAQENTVTQPILKGPISIAAGQAQRWIILLNPNAMSSAELHGGIKSTGGLGGEVTLSLYFGNQLVYNCPRRTECDIHEDLARGGTYTLVLDNTGSAMFARQVSGEVDFRYVK